MPMFRFMPLVRVGSWSVMVVLASVVLAMPAGAQGTSPALARTADAGEIQRWRIVDRRTIETYNLHSVSDAVGMVAGLTTVRTYSKRDIPTARGVLQSHYANRILVMIDGVPAWHATTGEGSLDRVSIEDVERIEVLLGPNSVLFGSEAYAGVVNIILRDNPSAGAHAGLGAPTRYDAGMRYQSNTDGLAWMVAGSLRDEDGSKYPFTDEAGVTGVIRDFSRAANVTFAGAYQAAGSTHRLFVNTFSFDESFMGTSPTFALGLGNDHLNRGIVASYGWARPIRERVDAEVNVSYDRGLRNFSRTRDDTVRADVYGFRVAADAAVNAHLSDRTRLRVGFNVDNRSSVHYDSVDVRADQVLDNNNMRNRGVFESSVFGQFAYSGPRLTAGAGVRFIGNENFGGYATAAGSVGYRLADDHRLSVRGGQSYRSPTLFELFFATSDRTVFGNVDLKPETSDDVEVEYEGQLDGVHLRADVYHAWYDQEIVRVRRVPDSTTDKSTIYTNGSPYTASGLEFEARYRVPETAAPGNGLAGSEVFVSYGFVRGSGSDGAGESATPFRFFPDHSVKLGLARQFGPVLASAVLERRSATTFPGVGVDGQGRIDLTASYTQRRGGAELVHTLSLVNATNSEQATPEYVRQTLNRIPSGLARSLSYGLRVRF